MTQRSRWPYWLLVAPMTLSVLLLCVIIFVSLNGYKVRMTYDCQLAEISPDIPMVVKEKCRELRRINYATY